MGTDPYTQAVSDVYQDLAGEGSYIGKGIYDVRIFHRLLGGRFPDALLLSHDLVEGAYVRVGLATDIELFDQFPSQLPGLRRPPAPLDPGRLADGRLVHARASPAGRRAADAGCRNPSRPSTAGRSSTTCAAAWCRPRPWPCSSPAGCSIPRTRLAVDGCSAVLLFVCPPVLQTAHLGAGQPRALTAPVRVGAGWREQSTGWVRAAVRLVLLPHQAADRPGRHRAASSCGAGSPAGVCCSGRRRAWPTSPPGSGSAGSSGAWAGSALFAVPSPAAVAWRWRRRPAGGGALPAPVAPRPGGRGLAQRQPRGAARVPAAFCAADRAMLHRLARQTWRYFDDLVGPQTNWLPPDNYQEALRVEVAPRTSPTNIGLWLLSALARAGTSAT